MLTPGYKLVVGKKAVDTTNDPQTSTAVEILVELDLDTPIDRAVLTLGALGGLQPAVDDPATIALGYADESAGLTTVITAGVVAVDQGLETARVTSYTAANTLLRTFVDRSYQSKTAGAIVQDLANEGKVAVATADDGITFPGYVVDGRRSVYVHMRELAQLCGFDLYINPDGKVVFQKFNGGNAVHVFESGKHILSLDVLRAQASAGSVVAWGESPTGSKGNDSWPWLTKDFSSSKGTSGSASPVQLLERPSLRTADAAQSAAAAHGLAIQQRTLTGRLLTIGRAEVKLGDAIALRSMADTTLNTSFQVRSVRHRVTKDEGFTTLVGFRAITVQQ
ncbi:MAG: hypothetical protein JOZ86_06485 [Candidatus Eremiobacteraeota bacterium]|nr:hypothetical protein [Candidatus Eremiobacteraeota bacterium]